MKIDLVGQRFNQLLVLRETSMRSSSGSIIWECKCDCGNITYVDGRHLRSGHTKSCGCLSKQLNSNFGNKNSYDLTNKTFGELLVLYPTTVRKFNNIVWHCKCSCGKECDVDTTSLTSGNTKSCGHLSYTDLSGKKFGKLTVLNRIKLEDKHHFYWNCLCDCGKHTNVRASDLITGNTKSCGCLRDETAMTNLKKLHKGPSKGELIIADILTKAKIPFETEKSFDDEKRVQFYRFDFYIPSINSCIEFQGIQHMEFSPFFYKNRSEFLKAQERDRIKISYCLSHGIKLYCIPYWEINNLHSIDDLFNEKFLAHSKFHNDEAYRHQKSKLIK